METARETRPPPSGAVCPFCSSASGRVWGRRDGRWIHECAGCRVRFFDRRSLPGTDYQHYYDYARSWDDARVSYELRLREGRYRKQLRAIRRRLGAGRRELLEIGAGPGYFAKVAMDEGFSVAAVELNETGVSIGRRQFGVRYATLDAIPERSVDIVAMFHVLEHIGEPAAFLRAVRSKMRAGGLLVVVVPHCEPLSYWLRNRMGLAGVDGKLCALYAPEHISGFTPASVVHGVERQGFRATSTRMASLWSRYYDPFFFEDMVRAGNWKAIIKKSLRGLVDLAGSVVRRGDWIVAHFRVAPDAARTGTGGGPG